MTTVHGLGIDSCLHTFDHDLENVFSASLDRLEGLFCFFKFVSMSDELLRLNLATCDEVDSLRVDACSVSD